MVAGAQLLRFRVQGLVFVGFVGFRVWLSLATRVEGSGFSVCGFSWV